MNRYADASTYPVWHDGATQVASFGSAPAHAEVDVAIVGGGLSGLWTAYYLSVAQPTLRIAILEARHIGFGASGRNGGWCSGFLPLSLSELATIYGRDAGLLAYQESFATLPEIEQVVRRENIDCGWHQGGTVQSATTALQAQRLQTHLMQQHASGLGVADAEWLPSNEVSKHISVAKTFGAIYSPHCATVNPYQLVNGLARVVQQRGVTIWPDTVVQAIDNGVVTHSQGRVVAKQVVQATEGYSHTIAQTKRRIVPLYSLMVATEPLDAATLQAIGWHNRATFNDGGQMVIYAQLTSDNRIAFGGRGAPYHFASRVRERFDLDDDTHRRIVAAIAQHFPAAAHARITHRWGGPLAVPRDWTPTVTIDRTHKYARLGGYVGDGVAATNLFARTLVDLLLERQTSLTQLPFVNHRSPRWEPEPLRFLGVNSLIALSESIDTYEARHGKEPRLRTKIFEALL
ncbi:MAG: FAD-dependent oxidoreductase [Ilumatobacteraceae bacterium]|nr:FAD-dependent oxidoreductase [Ilumatobacteraceae bacterium]